MDKRPDLYKVFKVDNQHTHMRGLLNSLGLYIRELLATGKPTVAFEIDRDIAALMASILIIDDPTI